MADKHKHCKQTFNQYKQTLHHCKQTLNQCDQTLNVCNTTLSMVTFLSGHWKKGNQKQTGTI